MKATQPGFLAFMDRTLLGYREDGKPPQAFFVAFYPLSEKNTVTANIVATPKGFDSIRNKEYEFLEKRFPHYFPKVTNDTSDECYGDRKCFVHSNG